MRVDDCEHKLAAQRNGQATVMPPWMAAGGWTARGHVVGVDKGSEVATVQSFTMPDTVWRSLREAAAELLKAHHVRVAAVQEGQKEREVVPEATAIDAEDAKGLAGREPGR